MTPTHPDTLFAYGTLQHPRIMQHVLGRIPEASPAVLRGFARYRMKGYDFPGIVPEADQEVDGTLFTGISATEWKRLDTYEADFYERLGVQVQLHPPETTPAFAYVVPPRNLHLISTDLWELKTYIPGTDSGIH